MLIEYEPKNQQMKNLILLSLLFITTTLYGQTDTIEKAVIYREVKAKNLRQDDFLRIWIRWNQAIKDFNGYPDILLDSAGQVHYSIVKEFTGFNKEKLFSRTLEWLSINYGLIPAYIYSNQEDGKIIFRNTLKLNSGFDCIYTSVITIKDEKILIEYLGISYQVFVAGHYLGQDWVPDVTTDIPLNQVFPIVLKRPAEWNSNLLILKSVNELFAGETNNHISYITSYDYSYRF